MTLCIMALDVECCYAKCRYAECHYSECRGTMPNLVFVGEANGTTTLSITTLSITTLSIKSLFVTLSINDTLHNYT
jgi:hypothetical protein